MVFANAARMALWKCKTMYIVTDVNGWLVMFLPSPWYLLGYLSPYDGVLYPRVYGCYDLEVR